MPLWIVPKDLASGSYNWEYYSPNVIRLNEVSYKKYSDLKLPLDDLSGKIISQLLALSTFQLYIIAFFVTEKLFSQCGRTCSISSIWKLIRNANAQAPPQTC